MKIEELTVGDYLTEVKDLSEDLAEEHEVAISMERFGDRRLCKNVMTSIALELELTDKEYEVSFDGDEQNFIMRIKDSIPAEPDDEPDDESMGD